MKVGITLFLLFSFLIPMQTFALSSDDQKFESIAKKYISDSLEMDPETATLLGEHKYDNLLSNRSAEAIKQSLKLNKDTLQSLATINANRLSSINKVDYKILCSNIESAIFQSEVLKEYEWNPRLYNVGDSIYSLLAREFAPLKTRLLSVEKRLKEIHSVISSAKTNLKNPPKIYTETAILQNKGSISLIKDDLNMFLEQVPELKKQFAPIQSEAVKELEEYGKWLEMELLPKSNGDFRLGDKLFRLKLKYMLESDMSKEEILQRAELSLRETQEEIYKAALPLYKKFFADDENSKKVDDKKHVVKSVLNKLSEERPDNNTIVDIATKRLEECTDFVRKHNLVTVPNEPVKVVVMPEFKRGVSTAYCDSPGALEKNGETFYAISPTPKDWSAQRTESFFKEYNNYMLQDLTVHEAMPGHYLQLAHANKFKAPTMIRAIFMNSPFVEGWAVYTEQLMVEKGYGGPEVKMQQLKMRLRLIINAIIDQKIHTEGMTEKQAMDLMMNEGFQEEGEAAGKWRRACLSSGQLSTYFVGNTEVNEIRKAYEKKMGSKSDMKTMHDKMISFGSIAPKYVKELMGL